MTPTNGMTVGHHWRISKIWWLAGILAVAAVLIVIVFEKSAKMPSTPYSTFLDQLDAGNVASVTFQGTEIDGRLKQPLDGTQGNAFRSRVPEFGDPALIPDLRKQHVTIDVASLSASWTRLLSGLPWPMLIFLGAMLVAGLVRVVRGGKSSSGSAMPMHPMQGIMGLVSGLFAKQEQPASPPTHNGGEQDSR
jgi:ATP-dependent Zn protease